MSFCQRWDEMEIWGSGGVFRGTIPRPISSSRVGRQGTGTERYDQSPEYRRGTSFPTKGAASAASLPCPGCHVRRRLLHTRSKNAHGPFRCQPSSRRSISPSLIAVMSRSSYTGHSPPAPPPIHPSSSRCPPTCRALSCCLDSFATQCFCPCDRPAQLVPVLPTHQPHPSPDRPLLLSPAVPPP
jgi:hypothetical protein